MKNNAIIKGRAGELLNALDARTFICIYKQDKAGKEELICSTNLYNILANAQFLEAYKDYEVIGITLLIGTTAILIKEV